MKKGSLYIIWNDINDKLYVGVTLRKVTRRFHEHIYAALNYKDKYRFHAAIRKYGADNFHCECLLSDIPKDRLGLFEMACIAYFNSYKNGYNGTPGGDSVGEVFEETRQKMSRIHAGKTPWNKGMPMPEWLKIKLFETHKGKKYSEETRRKMAEARKGRKPMAGKKHSEEARKKMSIARIGAKNHFYGKRHSEETKRKISMAKLKRKEVA